jgi:hypothetical protein
MNTRRPILVFALALVLAVALAGSGFAQTAQRLEPGIVSNVPVMRLFGVAKEDMLRLLNKGDVQTLSPAQPQTCVNGTSDVTPTACGQTVSGQLSSTDCFLPSDNSYFDFFSFQGTAGQTVTIDMASSAFDTYLGLIDPSPAVVAENDDTGSCPQTGGAGGGCNSRITFPLASSGTWVIVANSSTGNLFGDYTVTLACSGGGGGNCTPNSTTHCLLGGRYRVTAVFTPPTGTGGAAQALQPSVTSDTGLFWFFTANNIEIIIKVVSGCGFNSRVWVFSGGLTNVAYTITVTDTVTGISKTYSNPQGTPSQPIQDTNAFVCS